MKLQSQWTYCYKKGLRGAKVSKDHYLDGDKLFFVLQYGDFPWTSLILQLDLNTQECKTVYEEKHIVGRLGICDNDRFFFTSMRARVFCVAKDGTLVWETVLQKGNPSTEITMDGDRIFVSHHGVYSLDKNTGEILWFNDDYDQKTRCNLLNLEKGIVCGASGELFCLDKNSGESIWEVGEEFGINQCIQLENGHLLADHSHESFIIVDPNEGKLIKTIPSKGYLYGEPVLQDGKLYIGDGNDVMDSTSGHMSCYEVSGDDLKEVFSHPTSGAVSTSAVISGDRLFFATEDSYLYCIDKNTGEDLMAKKKTKGICRDIIVRENEVIVLSDKGQVEVFAIV